MLFFKAIICTVCIALALPNVHADVVSNALEWVFFSRKAHGRKIKVYSYLLTREQVAELLADAQNVIPTQKSNTELQGQPVYLVFRLDDPDHEIGSGSIAFWINGKYVLTSDICDTWRRPLLDYYVMPLGNLELPSNQDLPKIKHRFKTLWGG